MPATPDAPLSRPSCPRCGQPLNDTVVPDLCNHCAVSHLFPPDEEAESVHGVAHAAEVFDDAVPGLQFIAVVGSGGMGTVLKARQLCLDRDVAVKIIRHDKSEDPAYEAAFAKEATSLGRVDHPGIVRILDLGRTLAGRLYLVMEWVEGTTLRQHLSRRGALSPEELAGIILPLCDALHHAHDRCVLHQDLKPENILLTVDGRVKVADFGLARLGGHGGTAFGALGGSKHKSTGGTPGYMAPEQTAGGSALPDRRADVFAMGLMMKEMLTGSRSPHSGAAGPSGTEEAFAPGHETWPPDTPTALIALIHQAQSEKPNDRPASAKALALSLRSALGWSDGESAPFRGRRTIPSAWSRRRVMTGLVASACGGGAVAWWWKTPPPLMGAATTAAPSADPLQDPDFSSRSAVAVATVTSGASPAVEPLPPLSGAPFMPPHAPLSSAEIEMALRPLETSLTEDQRLVRLASFADVFIRTLDSGSPSTAEPFFAQEINLSREGSALLSFGQIHRSDFLSHWHRYEAEFPQRSNIVVGRPSVRHLSGEAYEVTLDLLARISSGHLIAKFELVLAIQLLATPGATPAVTQVRQADQSGHPQNRAEIRLTTFRLAQLVFENLPPASSSMLVGLFTPEHFFCGNPRSQRELKALVAQDSPLLRRGRLRLLNGPEMLKISDLLHVGIFHCKATEDLPEAKVRSGGTCALFLGVSFETTWPRIHSLDIRRLLA
jgi:serine/threonine protein kinase